MNIHEYQAKAILARHGLPVPRGEVAFTATEAREIATRLDGPVVVKAQIHAGGRGKGGGVKLAESAEEAERIARDMIGMRLVTTQTGPEGRVVSRVLVEDGLQVARELYLGLLVDRVAARPVLMASTAGGVEIEKVAADTPDLIYKEYIHPLTGVTPFQSRKLAFRLRLEPALIPRAAAVMQAMYDALCASDASLIEINPLVVTSTGELLGLDAKVILDDNALFRHADLRELRDFGEEETLEIEASKYALSYIRLDGAIGCMVNGAGSRWPPWMSSSWPVVNRQIFSTLAAVRAPNRFAMRSRSSCRTRTCERCSSTSLAASYGATWWPKGLSPRSGSLPWVCPSSSGWKGQTWKKVKRCSRQAA